MDQEILNKLYEPFEIKERRGVGNKIFKYVPSEDIVDRMNKVFQGNWSTEVKKVEIIEDQVLMCVRVYVSDPTTQKEFWQEGYASHMLARYTGAQNQGKIVDIGNSYKSAMSKAIKTAVAKWGVGLYLEEVNEESDTPVFTAPVATSSIPPKSVPNTAGINSTDIIKPVGPPMGIPVEVKKESTPVSIPSQSPIGMPPVGPSFGGEQSNNKANKPPVFMVENNGPPVSSPSTGFDLPTGGGIEKITDVQRVAIETLMSMHSIGFEELLSKALNRSDRLPKSLDDVAYLDAVTLIQYGNELRQI